MRIDGFNAVGLGLALAFALLFAGWWQHMEQDAKLRATCAELDAVLVHTGSTPEHVCVVTAAVLVP